MIFYNNVFIVIKEHNCYKACEMRNFICGYVMSIFS